jgi:hypothetical protein
MDNMCHVSDADGEKISKWAQRAASPVSPRQLLWTFRQGGWLVLPIRLDISETQQFPYNTLGFGNRAFSIDIDFLHFVFSACLMIPWILTIRVRWTGGCLEAHFTKCASKHPPVHLTLIVKIHGIIKQAEKTKCRKSKGHFTYNICIFYVQ